MPIFAIVLVGEVGGKGWRHTVKNVKVAEKHQS